MKPWGHVKTQSMMNRDIEQLAKRLEDSGYQDLLGDHPQQQQIDAIKSMPGVSHNLLSIINNAHMPWRARFLASEFLFRYVDMTHYQHCDDDTLQECYFQALRHNDTGNGVDWGFGKEPNELGVLGYMVTNRGGTVEAFKQGLSNEQEIILQFPWGLPAHYSPPYRIKDFCALIVSHSHGVPINLEGGSAERDKAIAQLKAAINTITEGLSP